MEESSKIYERFKVHAPVLNDIMADIAQYTLGGEYTLHTSIGRIIFQINGLNIQQEDGKDL